VAVYLVFSKSQAQAVTDDPRCFRPCLKADSSQRHSLSMDVLSRRFVYDNTASHKVSDPWHGPLHGASARLCQELQMTGTYTSTVLPSLH
jgi:hypothetical protein